MPGAVIPTRAWVAGAEVLEMAEYLLSEGYKDASAVLIGGSLEGHLFSLAGGHAIDTHFIDSANKRQAKKAEAINQELYKAGASGLRVQPQPPRRGTCRHRSPC